MYLQKTIRSEISCKSIGLHSGRKVRMTIKPAEADEGIVFVRTDLSGDNRIKANLNNVSDTTLATTLGLNGVRISTIEHLLSAFRGAGIDNALVEIDSFEVPIMDGSSLPFVNLLKGSGSKIQKKGRKYLIVKRPVSVSEGEGEAKLVPSAEFKITYKIDYEHPAVGEQTFEMVFSRPVYEQHICSARTFGFLKDVEYLQAKGLALGGSLRNAVVLDNEKVINKEGLRCPDEFVKHKVLDAIGDLYLLGIPIVGHFIAYKSGHRLNNLLMKKLVSDRNNWAVINHMELSKYMDDIHDRPALDAFSLS